jgi:hypothetical protein
MILNNKPGHLRCSASCLPDTPMLIYRTSREPGRPVAQTASMLEQDPLAACPMALWTDRSHQPEAEFLLYRR